MPNQEEGNSLKEKQKKPIYQVLLTWIVLIFTGFIVPGSLLDSISNAITLITPQIASWGSATILIIWTIALVYLRFHPITWITREGKPIRITKVNSRINLPLLGIILLLWIPQLTNIHSTTIITEQPGQVLVVIAPFYYTEGTANTEAHREIARRIQSTAQEAGITNLRIEFASIALRADDRTRAEQLGTDYDASLVIWGDENKIRLTANFLNRRANPATHASDVTISETERTQIRNPPAYAKFVLDELPNKFSFLALFAVGQLSANADDYPNAQRTIEEAIKIIPPSMSIEGLDAAYFTLGWLYQTQDDMVRAITNYNQAIFLNPQNATVYCNRGVARHVQGDISGAITDYNQAIALEPRYPFPYINRGVARRILGDISGAITDYNQGIALGAQYAFAYSGRGKTRGIQGDIPGAIVDFNQAIALDPQDASTYSDRGTAHYFQGDMSKAIADYDRAIALDPKDATIYVNRGIARRAHGDIPGAIADYDKAIALNPKNAKAYLNRGIARTAQGDTPGAISDFEQTLRFTNDSEIRHEAEEYIQKLHEK